MYTPLGSRRHYGAVHSYDIELCRLDVGDIERLAISPDMSIVWKYTLKLQKNLIIMTGTLKEIMNFNFVIYPRWYSAKIITRVIV